MREELRAATARELTIADPNRLSWEALRGFSVAEWLSHWRCACGGECIPERVRRGEMAFWERHLSTGSEHTCGQGSHLRESPQGVRTHKGARGSQADSARHRQMGPTERTPVKTGVSPHDQ